MLLLLLTPLLAGDPVEAPPIDDVADAQPLEQVPDPWDELAERLDVSGDLRLRYERDVDRPGGLGDRDRFRVRGRLGGTLRVADDVLVGARLTTGDPDDPNSPHVTLGDGHGYDELGLSLDRLHVTWEPGFAVGAWVTGGKFASRLRSNPVYGELVWDADVQPEGVAAGWGRDTAFGVDRLDLVAGLYELEDPALADGASVLVAQVSGRRACGEDLTGDLALGVSRYSDPTPDGAQLDVGDDRANAVVDTDGDGDADAFASGFTLYDAVLSATYDGAAQPVTVAAQWIHNARAAGSEDTGYALGLSAGRARQRGDWQAYYQLQVVEQDAVFAAFAHDDFLLATNHRSHVAGVRHRLRDAVELHLWALVSEQESDGSNPGWRVRLDLNVGF